MAPEIPAPHRVEVLLVEVLLVVVVMVVAVMVVKVLPVVGEMVEVWWW